MVSDCIQESILMETIKCFLAGEMGLRGKKKGNTTSLHCIASAKKKWSNYICIFLFLKSGVS